MRSNTTKPAAGGADTSHISKIQQVLDKDVSDRVLNRAQEVAFRRRYARDSSIAQYTSEVARSVPKPNYLDVNDIDGYDHSQNPGLYSEKFYEREDAKAALRDQRKAHNDARDADYQRHLQNREKDKETLADLKKEKELSPLRSRGLPAKQDTDESLRIDRQPHRQAYRAAKSAIGSAFGF